MSSRTCTAADHGVIAKALLLIPRGRALPADVWDKRHRGIVMLLWLHVFGIFLFGLVKGVGVRHSLVEAAIIAIAAIGASWQARGRPVRGGIASLGLVMSSAILVHLSGGYIEFHFHFFVMIGVMALYQHWGPFLVALGYVVAHHGVVGVLSPRDVYNHEAAIAHPWRWAALHGVFVLAASAASLIAWRLNEFQALHDPLTKLGNRRLFKDRAEHALRRIARRRTRVAVLYVDLDDFKKVNDRLGHEAGDQLLVAAGDRLRGCLRAADTASRLGGDEFAILLEDVLQPAEATDVARRVLAAIEEPFTIRGERVVVTASVGIAFDRAGITAEELVRHADVAMYEAKASGSGCMLFERAMQAAVVKRLELEAALKQAVQAREFSVHYQPVVDLDTERIRGFEALVRWNHPERGLLTPAEFIGVAEETGLIVPIGRWVLQEACREAKSWERFYGEHGPLAVGVNLSHRQLQHPALVDDVAEALAAAGLEPERLVLEITESAAVQDVELATDRLAELKTLGVSLAMDDFGTGYSSLNYLRRFPIDILKIDRSFINQLADGADGEALTAAIVTFGATLRMETVAEGIEDRDQRDRLRRMNCRLGQGFYFAKPLTTHQVEALLSPDRGVTAAPLTAALSA